VTTPGPVALIGGGEHLSGCEPIESRLMELVGASRPHVVVMPVAPAPRHVPSTAALARNYWTRLGARVSIADPRVDLAGTRDAIRAADVVVLPGGHPNKLVQALGASPVTDLLVERWTEGLAIAASSAGAMCLFEWRIKLYPPNPLRLIPGLGLMDGFVAAPHFERFAATRWSHRALVALRGLQVLGLDERTAVVGWPQELEVQGQGTATLVGPDGTVIFRAGDRMPVDLTQGSGDRRSVGLPHDSNAQVGTVRLLPRPSVAQPLSESAT
jgi:cyanophycinase